MFPEKLEKSSQSWEKSGQEVKSVTEGQTSGPLRLNRNEWSLRVSL